MAMMPGGDGGGGGSDGDGDGDGNCVGYPTNCDLAIVVAFLLFLYDAALSAPSAVTRSTIGRINY